MSLSYKQYQTLRQKGLSQDQIIRFAKGEKPEASPINIPLETLKGGAIGTMESLGKTFIQPSTPTIPGGGATSLVGPVVGSMLPPSVQREGLNIGSVQVMPGQKDLMSPGGMIGLGLGLLGAKSPKVIGALEGTAPALESATAKMTKPFSQFSSAGKGLKELGKEYPNIPKGELPSAFEEAAKIKKTEITQHELDFADALNDFKDKGAVSAKYKIAKFGENLSKSYDKKIDHADQILTKSDNPINVTKMDVAKNWIETAINKLSGHRDEQARLINQVKKLGYDAMPGAFDEYGNAVWNVLPDSPDAKISFRDLINHKNEISSLKGNASSAAKHSFVDFLSDDKKFPFNISQIYKEMQNGYGPLADAKWQAYKIFKPFDRGNVDTKQAANFFDRIAQDTLKSGEQRLLDMIEKGSEFSPGVGDISSAIRKFGLEKRQKGLELSREFEDIKRKADIAKTYLESRKDMNAKMAKVGTAIAALMGLKYHKKLGF